MKKNTKKVMAAVLSGTMVLSSASGVFAAGPGAVTSTEVTQHEIDSAIISQQLATEGMVLLENKTTYFRWQAAETWHFMALAQSRQSKAVQVQVQ